MAEHKNQHFVSQFLLRNFSTSSSRKVINLFHLPTGRFVKDAAIRNQACGDYFYERGTSVEQALSKFEGMVGSTIEQMLVQETLPKWRSREHHDLLLFVELQHSKTRFAAAEAADMFNGMRAQLIGNNPEIASRSDIEQIDPANILALLLRIAAINHFAGIDLRYKLFRNLSAIPFITSDHPVAFYNQFYESGDSRRITSDTGIACRGIQIFFPVGPKHLLALFDADVYKVGGRNFRVVCVDVTEDDVHSLNVLQAVNADAHLYFNESADIRYISRIVRDAKPFMKTEKGFVNEGPAYLGNVQYGSIIQAR
jgi:uncharacterized protein DUF4238